MESELEKLMEGVGNLKRFNLIYTNQSNKIAFDIDIVGDKKNGGSSYYVLC